MTRDVKTERMSAMRASKAVSGRLSKMLEEAEEEASGNPAAYTEIAPLSSSSQTNN